MSTPTISQLHQAVSISEQIEKLKAELASIIGGSSPASKTASAPAVKSGKRKMSAATIAKMRASQQARRAKGKAPATAPAKTSAPKKQSAMSAEHRAKLAAAAKNRWAAIKAGKAANPFGTKKGGAMVRRKIANAGQPKFRII